MIPSVTQNPFTCIDVFAHTMSFVKVFDFLNAACVCKLWKQYADDLSESYFVWKSFSENQGIPMVSRGQGRRNYAKDFCIILSKTSVSGEKYRKFFGEPSCGHLPSTAKMRDIHVEIFNKIAQSDDYELIVEYPFVERVLGTNETPLTLDENYNLVLVDPSTLPEVSIAQVPTRIPFTLYNRIRLGMYPLMGKENMPIFGFILNEAVFQNDYCPSRVNVYYQTRKVIAETKNMAYAEQKSFVENMAMRVVPLGLRVLSDTLQIAESGIYPDGKDSWARTSSPVFFNGVVYQSVIGDFDPNPSLDIDYNDDSNYANIGVVAGGPAEAPLAPKSRDAGT